VAHAIELIARLRDKIGEPYTTYGTDVAGTWKDKQLLGYLNNALEDIYSEMRLRNKEILLREATLTESATEQVYAFPVSHEIMSPPFFIFRTSSITRPVQYRQIEAQRYTLYSLDAEVIAIDTSIPISGLFMRWTNNRLRVETKDLASSSLTLFYQWSPPMLTFGVAANTSGANTTITLENVPAMATEPEPSNIDDYYIDAEITTWQLSSAYSNQRRTFSDYVGLTHVATVSADWTTNPSTVNSAKYATHPALIPERWMEYLIDRGAAQAMEDEKEYREAERHAIKARNFLAANILPSLSSEKPPLSIQRTSHWD